MSTATEWGLIQKMLSWSFLIVVLDLFILLSLQDLIRSCTKRFRRSLIKCGNWRQAQLHRRGNQTKLKRSRKNFWKRSRKRSVSLDVASRASQMSQTGKAVRRQKNLQSTTICKNCVESRLNLQQKCSLPLGRCKRSARMYHWNQNVYVLTMKWFVKVVQTSRCPLSWRRSKGK